MHPSASAVDLRVRHPAFRDGLTRQDLALWYRRARKRTRSFFAIPRQEAYHSRPIELRNPIVFYEGHLPAFSVNTLVKLAQGGRGVDDEMEQLFERGIDPADPTSIQEGSPWPSRMDVQAYVAAAEALVEKALLNLSDRPIEIEAAGTILEHELMHQETLLYMLHNLPHKMKRGESGALPPARAGRMTGAPLSVRIPAGVATLGAERNTFGWDNEFPQHRVSVPEFEVDRFNVTNGDYLEFMRETGAPAPHFWVSRDGEWCWRGMFDVQPLTLDSPVFVTHEQAEAFASWRGRRLPSEPEYHRAAFGTPGGAERTHPWGDAEPERQHGNFDLQSWDPQPVGSHPAGASAWGVHDLAGDAWEWTSTRFNGFRGFEPMQTYRAYSADFFDDAHYVMKGASMATPRELIRASFRNWFRPNYPFVYGKFRLARE